MKVSGRFPAGCWCVVGGWVGAAAAVTPVVFTVVVMQHPGPCLIMHVCSYALNLKTVHHSGQLLFS